MLELTIPATEGWDEAKQEFVTIKEQTLRLEHSLVSLSKWESKYCKAYLSSSDKTTEETFDYIRFMTINKVSDPVVYNFLTPSQIKEISDYINTPRTATKFKQEKKAGVRGGGGITSEIIYSWMVAYQIPFECQKWHLSRLIALIEACQRNNQPNKKTNRRELLQKHATLNAQRRAQFAKKG